MNQEEIGKFIKKLRKDNNLTQAEFAKKYGVTYQAVSNWEHGKNLPDVSLLKQMSEDFCVSIDELLGGKKIDDKKKVNLLVPIILILFLVIVGIIFLYFKNQGSYEFKTLSATCENFTISGSLAYDKKKTSIFINKVDYCGGNDEVEYDHIECILYEVNGDMQKEISSYKNDKKQTLEEFLKDVEFTIDDYNRTCKIFTDNNLYLSINAKDEDDKVTTYKVPLELNEKCEN